MDPTTSGEGVDRTTYRSFLVRSLAPPGRYRPSGPCAGRSLEPVRRPLRTVDPIPVLPFFGSEFARSGRFRRSRYRRGHDHTAPFWRAFLSGRAGRPVAPADDPVDFVRPVAPGPSLSAG